jgi:hypothetical protein
MSVFQIGPMPATRSRRFDDPAQQASGLLIRLGVAVLALGVPGGAIFSRRLIFSMMPVGAALVLLGVMLSPKRADLGRLRAIVASPTALTALFLLGWAGLTLIWTPFANLAAERYFKTAGTLLLAALTAGLLPQHTKTSNLYLLPIGLGVAAIAALAIGVVAPPVSPAPDIESSTLDRAALTLTMLLWPALGALAVRDRWASAGALAVAVAIAIIAVWTPTALAALSLGAITFSLATTAPQRVGRILGIVFGALVAIAPAIPVALAPLCRASASVFAKAILTAEQIVLGDPLRLLTGHGLDAAQRSISIGYLPATTPRSAIFEVWYEFGVVGALALAVLVALAFRSASLAPRPASAFLLAGLVCGVVIGISGLVTAQLWWLTLLAVAGVQFALVVKGQYRSVRPAAKTLSAEQMKRF